MKKNINAIANSWIISICIGFLSWPVASSDEFLGLKNVYQITDTVPRESSEDDNEDVLVMYEKPCSPDKFVYSVEHNFPEDSGFQPVIKHTITDVKKGDLFRIRSQVQMTISRSKVDGVCREFAGQAFLQTKVNTKRRGNVAQQRNYNEGTHHMPMHNDTLYIADSDSKVDVVAEYKILTPTKFQSDPSEHASEIDEGQSQLIIEHYRKYQTLEEAALDSALGLKSQIFSATREESLNEFNSQEAYPYKVSNQTVSEDEIILTMGQTTTGVPDQGNNAVLQMNRLCTPEPEGGVCTCKGYQQGEPEEICETADMGESISENLVPQSAVKSQWTYGLFKPTEEDIKSFVVRVRGLKGENREPGKLIGNKSNLLGHIIFQQFAPISSFENEKIWLLDLPSDSKMSQKIGTETASLPTNNEWKVVKYITRPLSQDSLVRITGMTQFILKGEDGTYANDNTDGQCETRLFVAKGEVQEHYTQEDFVRKSAFSRKSISLHESTFQKNSWPHQYPDIPLKNELAFQITTGTGVYTILQRARCSKFPSHMHNVTIKATGSGLIVEEYKPTLINTPFN